MCSENNQKHKQTQTITQPCTTEAAPGNQRRAVRTVCNTAVTVHEANNTVTNLPIYCTTYCTFTKITMHVYIYIHTSSSSSRMTEHLLEILH